jgi:hypothetical protein
MARVIDELQVCGDCLMIIANDDETGIESEADIKRIRNAINARSGYLYLGNEEKNGGFSWRSCECCNNGLGGERYHVVELGD